ncbi:hypothetical protein [Cellulosimicrobium cellulans]|uniref:hypothetical protein n=1 Tax=Cellulosimicrobium cellulans TaxID=1710 RepID=UPI001BAB3173|nr:hypothetical protein [Cellulosimicrobium cellulans]QUC00624.1 hypothetical protein J5A69_05170 [Cellulosimicrobium cellulans]
MLGDAPFYFRFRFRFNTARLEDYPGGQGFTVSDVAADVSVPPALVASLTGVTGNPHLSNLDGQKAASVFADLHAHLAPDENAG